MKVLNVEAKGASKEELEAIKIAIEELGSEIFFTNNENDSDGELKEWRFSGRWWLDGTNENQQSGTWG
jgi:hypothetical protein